MAPQFNPLHFFDVSEFIYEKKLSDKEESCYRTAIGRIYYSIFLKIRSRLSREAGFHRHSGNIGSDKSHKAVITFLQGKGGEFGKLGDLLEKLKGMRINSDYLLERPIFDNDVKIANAYFTSIKEKCEKCGYW